MERFFRIPESLYFDRELSDKAKLMFAYLIQLADVSEMNGHDHIFPKEKTLAEKLGVNVRTITRNLQALEQAGYLKIDRAPGKISKIYLTPDTNVGTDKNVGTTPDKNVVTPPTKMSGHSKRNNRTNKQYMNYDREHKPSFETELFMKRAENPVYPKKEGA